MSVSFATARAAVQAANAAGKKVTIVTTDGARIAGTARWRNYAEVLAGGTEPQLTLFGAKNARGPWTENTAPGAPVRTAVTPTRPAAQYDWVSDYVGLALLDPRTGVEQVDRGAITIPLAKIASIAQTANGDADLLPWETADADAAAARLSPELAAAYGTGTE